MDEKKVDTKPIQEGPVCHSAGRNDMVIGAQTEITLDGETLRVEVAYPGIYGLGFDGCGTHTHNY